MGPCSHYAPSHRTQNPHLECRQDVQGENLRESSCYIQCIYVSENIVYSRNIKAFIAFLNRSFIDERYSKCGKIRNYQQQIK